MAYPNKTSQSLHTLKINKVPDKDTFIKMEEDNLINANELYLVEGDPSPSVTSVNGQTGAVTVIEDDKTWNGVTLITTETQSNAAQYIPVFQSRQLSGNAGMLTATSTPAANKIPKYNNSGYLISTTPTANDNSTKVATTAYVDNAVPTKTSDLTNDSGFLTSFTETDPTVPSWAKASTKPTYTASEIQGALTSFYLDQPKIPEPGPYPNIQLALGSSYSIKDQNNGTIQNFIMPSVPTWALAENKPTYTATEVGALPSNTTYVSSVNGQSGAVTITDSDEKVKHTDLNGTNSGKPVLLAATMLSNGNSRTETVYSSTKLMWNDYSPNLSIYNSDRSKYSSISATRIGLANSSTAYTGALSLSTLSSDRTYTLPNKSGTIALTTDIPTAVTESTVSGWGFTKNTGTYSKPSGGIPKTDLASAVQTSLEKADTALQSYTESDPVFTASAAHGIASTDITNWNNKISEPASEGTNGQVLMTNGNGTRTWGSVSTADEKIKLTSQSTSGNYPLIFGPTSITSNSTYQGYYNTGITINPSTKAVTATTFVGALTGTASGNLTSSSTLDASKLSGTIPSGIEATTQDSSDNSTKIATTAFVKNNLGGLSGAMHFKGTTTTALTDGTTTAAVTINSSSYTPSAGDVVLYDNKEFVWTGSLWELLGDEGSYKVKQSAVSSPTANGNTTAFIDTISQDANGVITVTKRNLDTSGTWSGNATTATTASKLGSSNLGSATKPIYLTSGNATEGSTYAGGTAVTLNNSSKAASTASFYAPTTGGTQNTQALIGDGATAAPKWINISPSITITAGTGSAAPKVNVTVLGQSGTAQAITTASTSVYGCTKLSSTASTTEEGLAATPKGVQAAINNLDVSSVGGSTGEYIASISETDGKISAVKATTTVSNTWTAGTTAGPTLSTTVNSITGTAVAIPAAAAGASGVVTTAAQQFDGNKTFKGNIYPQANNTYSIGSTALGWKELILSEQSSANSLGVQFSSGSAIGARVGANTSGEIGVYGSKVYLRPSLTATDVGLILASDKTVYPAADSTHSLGTTSSHWQHGYFDDLYVSTDTGYTANNSAKVGTTIASGQIDLTNATPKIQFHRATAAAVTGTIQSETDYGITLNGVASATGASVNITGTAGSTGITYASRTIKPILRINGIAYSTSNIETAGYFLNNTAGGNNTGFYLYGNGAAYGRYYVNTIGKAGTATTFTNPDDETQTVTGYTDNVVGIGMLQLGNDTAVGTNGTSYSSPGTAGNANNARGYLRMYGQGTNYTDLLAQGNGNRTCYLPNYAGTMYLVHASSNSAVGGAATPVYIAANGRVTACTAYTGLLTALSWTAGTTAGPTLSITVGGTTKTAVIPSAGASASGVVTTGAQTFAGDKTFSGCITFSKTTDANMTSDAGPALIVGGTRTTAHIELDANEIIAKSNGTTGTDLWLNGLAKVTADGKVYGAVWNDYAEYRITQGKIEPGRCIRELGDDTLELTTERLQKGCEIISDTFGFAIGQTDKAQTPIAASGRVLAYPYESLEEFKKAIGRPVCSGPDGTVSIMTNEEYQKFGYCAIGTISAVPEYETWGENNIAVNNRVWIRVK